MKRKLTITKLKRRCEMTYGISIVLTVIVFLLWMLFNWKYDDAAMTRNLMSLEKYNDICIVLVILMVIGMIVSLFNICFRYWLETRYPSKRNGRKTNSQHNINNINNEN